MITSPAWSRVDKEQGKKFSPERIKFMEEKAVLKKTVSLLCDALFACLLLNSTKADLEDTADAYIMLAKNTSITGMKIQIGKSRQAKNRFGSSDKHRWRIVCRYTLS